MTIKPLIGLTLGAALLVPLYGTSAFGANKIMNKKECLSVVKDTEQAIDENPALGDKAEKILMAVMDLAKTRCEEKQFDNASDLLELARGMVASE